MPAERIASLLAAGTEIVAELGLLDRLVAISHECDRPAGALSRPRVTRTRIDPSRDSADVDRQVRAALAAGLPLYDIDLDALTRLAPDLILTQTHCEVCAIDVRAVQTAVAAAPALTGATVVSLNPVSLRDVLADLQRVADAAGATVAGREAVERLQTRINAVAGRTASRTDADRPRVACIEWVEPLMIAANWMPELVHLAGGQCDLTRPGERSRVTRWDDVIAFDPEIIVVMPCGFDLDRAVREAATLSRLPGWRRTSAVRSGRVYAADGNRYFNRSGPGLVDSLELLTALLNHEAATDARFAGAIAPLSDAFVG